MNIVLEQQAWGGGQSLVTVHSRAPSRSERPRMVPLAPQGRCITPGSLEASWISVVWRNICHKENVIKTINYIDSDQLKIAVNSDYKTGKTTSIKSGLKHVAKESTDIILLAIDQPRSPETISRVLTGHISINALITSPNYNGHGGHPLIFSSSLKTELNKIDEQTQGIRKVLKSHDPEINSLNIDDPSLRLDFNTPEEYEDAVIRDRIWQIRLQRYFRMNYTYDTSLLKKVSRSFYITIRLLPKAVRIPISIAYMLARTADTITDTTIFENSKKSESRDLLNKSENIREL